MSIRHVPTIFLLALGVAACGGGAHTDTAHGHGATVNGHAVVNANGEAVSEEAHNAWRGALAVYNRYDAATGAAGWSQPHCDEVAGKFQEAADRQGGRFPEALYMAGLVRSKCNQRDQALDMYNRALSVNDKFCKARVAIGLDQLRQNNTSGALQTFQRSVTDDASCTEGYVNLASLQRTSNDPAQVREALNNLRRALAIDAQYLPAFNEMALLYYDQSSADASRLDLASVVCRQAQQINHDYAAIYNTWGLIWVKKGDIIQALRMFERATHLDDDMFEGWMNFGEITLSFRGYEDAQHAFQRATELQPNNYDAHLGLGAALRGLNKLDEAEAQYNAAKALDASRAEAYYNLGILWQDYRAAAPNSEQTAKGLYAAFIQRAGNNAAFADQVTEINRHCNTARGRRRHMSTSTCRPGRLQLYDLAADAMRQIAEAQAAQAQMQAMAARNAAAQQQANPTPTPGGTTPPPGGATPPPGGTTPPAGGGTTPPAGGAAAPPAGGAATPPATPAAGGAH